jgi:demethylmenaquinone methyltransferase/2-methoxy-6-polyprenyl-1,4-benzoquinol methylase
MSSKEKTTHFCYTSVAWDEKEKKVAEVFHSVAQQYDLMNNLMSFGIHHLWKRFAIELSAIRSGQTVLDLAGGSGDLTRLLAKKMGTTGTIVLADINESMLQVGRSRLLDQGIYKNVHYVQGNAQSLPFEDNRFHCIIMSFGLRNVTDKEKALQSMYRVCRPGGKLMILEFSTPTAPGLKPLYDWYSFHVLPKLGKLFADDEDSYRYLAESIRMHPNQTTLKQLIEQAGFETCRYHNLSGGIVALHTAYKY